MTEQPRGEQHGRGLLADVAVADDGVAGLMPAALEQLRDAIAIDHEVANRRSPRTGC